MTPSAGGDVGPQEVSLTAGGRAEWCTVVEESLEVSYETQHTPTCSLVFTQRSWKSMSARNLRMDVTAALFLVPKHGGNQGVLQQVMDKQTCLSRQWDVFS